ncbi:WD40-repeat-containing domain protein [Lipomyces chichibuensis]|uniref:WD40-repeat-containing domain protein n=1 Tax=Lipomyces chichibuensis TaxID=1546026 RepID=UPI003342F6AA
MSISSKELNYLIWRYLQESGFSHATYAFQHETEADRLDEMYGPVTPIGLLVSVFQKGLHYMEIESLLNPDGTERQNPEPFSLFSGAIAKSLEVLPDGTEHEASNAVDVPMTNASEDINGQQESTERGDIAIAATMKTTHTTIDASASSPSRKYGIEQPLSQRSPSAREGYSEAEPKRVKTSHNRSASVTPADICQSPEPTTQSTGVDLKSEKIKSRNQVILLPEVKSATDCTWSNDGSHLAISTSTSEVFVYAFSGATLSPQSPRKVKLASSQEISSISLTSSLLAIGTYSGAIQMWCISEKSPAVKAILSGFHSAPVLSAEFTTIDGRMALVTIDCLRKAGVWDISATGSFWFSLVPSSSVDHMHDGDEIIKDAISDVKILSDRKSVATTTGKNGTLDIYDLVSAPKNEKLHCTYMLSGHTKVVNVLYYSPASGTSPEMFISGSEDNSIRVWDLASRSAKYVLEGHHTGVMALKVGSLDVAGKRNRIRTLASGDFAGRLRLWDLDTGAMIAKVEYSYPVFAFGFVGALSHKEVNSNGNGSRSSQHQRVTLLTGSKDGIVNMWGVDEVGAGHRISSLALEDGLGGITGVAVCESNTYGDSMAIVAGRTKSCLVQYSG